MKTRLMRWPLPFLAACFLGLMPPVVSADGLPQRSGPAPKTTNSVPHIQTGIQPNPAILANLLSGFQKYRALRSATR